MKVKLIFIFSLFLPLTIFGEMRDYSERDAEVIADSVKIGSILNSISSEIARQELKEALDRISHSRRIFKEFTVDIYSRNMHKYKLSNTKKMTIAGLLDSIGEEISKAAILRINKLELDNGDAGKLKLSDNSFKDLSKNPSFRNKDVIMAIIESSALGSGKKSSLEWIWGKSSDNDAYYSTKLTYFEDRFTLYPDYRMFVGNDPLRDKKSWFFALEDHPKPEPIAVAVSKEPDQEIIKEPATNTLQTVPDQKQEDPVVQIFHGEEQAPEVHSAEAAPEFDCGSSEFGEISYESDVSLYEKNENGDMVITSSRMEIGGILGMAAKARAVKFIRLSSTDFTFDGNSVTKVESETIIEITGDVLLCANRLKAYLAEAMTDPNKKRSAEFITGKNNDKMSYTAGVITVFGGMTSYFSDYKIYAASETRKDRNSWFNRM
jgi:hypothetical protein